MRYDYKKGLFIKDECPKDDASFLAVNWNVVGACNNRCVYCYGEDIREIKIDEELSTKIALIIAGMDFDLLVITGGEPLLMKNLTRITDILADKTNVILDTNGIFLSEDLIDYFSEKKIHIRVSLDSDNPALNEKLRPSYFANSTKTILKNIASAVGIGLPLTVQTTVTPINLPYLDDLAKKLRELNVNNWRVSAVIPHDLGLVENLSDSVKRLKESYPDILIRCANVDETNSDHIVLIDPLGRCFTRNSITNEKKQWNDDFSSFPSKKELLQGIDIAKHIKRYLYEG